MAKAKKKVGAAKKRTKKVVRKTTKKSAAKKPVSKTNKVAKKKVAKKRAPKKAVVEESNVVDVPKSGTHNTVITINGIRLYTRFAGANCVDDVFNSRTKKLSFASVANEYDTQRLTKLCGREYEITISYSKGAGVQQGAVPATVRVTSVAVADWLRKAGNGMGVANVSLTFEIV